MRYRPPLEADDPNNVRHLHPLDRAGLITRAKVAVYKHLGFQVAATAELPRIEGGSFAMWSMRWSYRGECEQPELPFRS